MSNIETNKKAVLAFAEAYSRGDWDAVEACFTEDFRWVVPTAPEPQSALLRAQPNSLTKADRNREETLQIYKFTQGMCVDGKFTISILNMIGENDQLAVEATSHAVSNVTGRVYDNQYVYMLVFRDGKISLFREYQDTLHAFDVWMAS